MSSFSNETNPLLARSRRNRGVFISLAAALGLLAAGTLAVSAQTTSQPQAPQAEQNVQIANAEMRTGETGQTSQPRRQVRVIPLFNQPVNPTGFQK
jgi:hypothetical protein